jgi:NADPH-dependent 2,4-dienoyl-CoA reductase/sulfur reductase-like enzyme
VWILFFGDASFVAPDAIRVASNVLRFKKALIATGTRPTIPSIDGLARTGYRTHETIFELKELPNRLVAIGGGPVGCELAQAFCRLGSQVTIVQKEPMFLSNEERDAAQILHEAFDRDGIEIHLNTETVAVRSDGQHKLIDVLREGNRMTVTADEILVGVGETPNVDSLNLEAARVEYDAVEGIRVDDFLATTNPDIYALVMCAQNEDLLTLNRNHLPLSLRMRSALVVLESATLRFHGALLRIRKLRMWVYMSGKRGKSKFRSRASPCRCMKFIARFVMGKKKAL